MSLINALGQNVQIFFDPEKPAADLVTQLVPGRILQGRVLDVLADGKALLNFYGYTVSAEAPAGSLEKGTLLRAVVQTAGETPVLQILRPAAATAGSPSLATSGAPNLAAILGEAGIPVNGRTMQVADALLRNQVPITPATVLRVLDRLDRIATGAPLDAPPSSEEAPALPADAAAVRRELAGRGATVARQLATALSVDPETPLAARVYGFLTSEKVAPLLGALTQQAETARASGGSVREAIVLSPEFAGLQQEIASLVEQIAMPPTVTPRALAVLAEGNDDIARDVQTFRQQLREGVSTARTQIVEEFVRFLATPLDAEGSISSLPFGSAVKPEGPISLAGSGVLPSALMSMDIKSPGGPELLSTDPALATFETVPIIRAFSERIAGLVHEQQQGLAQLASKLATAAAFKAVPSTSVVADEPGWIEALAIVESRGLPLRMDVLEPLRFLATGPNLSDQLGELREALVAFVGSSKSATAPIEVTLRDLGALLERLPVRPEANDAPQQIQRFTRDHGLGLEGKLAQTPEAEVPSTVHNDLKAVLLQLRAALPTPKPSVAPAPVFHAAGSSTKTEAPSALAATGGTERFARAVSDTLQLLQGLQFANTPAPQLFDRVLLQLPVFVTGELTHADLTVYYRREGNKAPDPESPVQLVVSAQTKKLGPVAVRLSMAEAKARVTVDVTNEPVRRVFEQGGPDLMGRLERAGYSPDRYEVRLVNAATPSPGPEWAVAGRLDLKV